MDILIALIIVVWCILFYNIYSQLSELKKEVSFLKNPHWMVSTNNEVDKTMYQDDVVVSSLPSVDQKGSFSPDMTTHDVVQWPSKFDLFVQRFKIDRPMKVWWLLFVLWIWWFVSYAIQNNRISPELRIGMSILVGLLMIWFGCYQTTKQPVQWSYLIGIGSAVYVVSIFLWLKIFGFFGVPLGLWLVALQYVRMAYFSHRYKNHRLNDVWLFFSMISPFLFSDGSGNVVWLFTYLVIHLIWSTVIWLLNKRSRSRFMNVLYLALYIILGYLSSAAKMSLYPIIGMVSGLVAMFSVVEIYSWVIKRSIWSTIQYAIVVWSGLIMFIYTASLYQYHADVVLANIMMVLCLLLYGWLWYAHSMMTKQSVYSVMVWMFAILFAWSLAYHNLSGMSLLLSSILIFGIVMINVMYITKDQDSIRITSILGSIPLGMWLYQLSLHIGIGNIPYLVSVYTAFVVMVILAFIARYLFADNKSLMISFWVVSLWLLYHGLSMNFDGYMRITVLAVVWLLLILLWYIVKTSRILYIAFSLFAFALPLIYMSAYWLEYNIMLLWCAGAVLVGLTLATSLTYSLTSQYGREESYLLSWLYWLILVLLHLSVVYMIHTDWYTLSYTILALLIYGVGTRMWWFFGRAKMIYSLFLVVPLVTSIGLLDATNFIQTLSTIILSASFLWMRVDNNKVVSQNRLWYVYYFFFLLSLGTSIVSFSQDIIQYQEIVVILLIAFSALWLVFYIAGKKYNHMQHRIIWTVLLLAVIARIFFVELWLLSLVMKIVVCLVIGTLMIVSWFVGNKKIK